MNSIQIYCGEKSKSALPFLQKLGLSAQLREDLAGSDGFLLETSSFGVKKQIRVQDDSSLSSQFEGYLYYQSLAIIQITALREHMSENPSYRVYLLCHNHFSLFAEYLKIQEYGLDVSRVSFIVAPFQSAIEVLSAEELKKYIAEVRYNEIFTVQKLKIRPRNSEARSAWSLGTAPLALIVFLRVLLAPIQALKRLVFALKIKNLVWSIRTDELFRFLFYLLTTVLLGPVYGIFVDGFHFTKRNLIKAQVTVKVFAIRLGFKSKHLLILTRARYIRILRHYLLLAYFKLLSFLFISYGVGVDVVNFLVRFIKLYIYIPLRFKLILRLGYFLTGLLYRSWGVGVITYHFFHRILVLYVLNPIIYKVLYPTGYFLRGTSHWTYGGLVIVYHAVNRVTKFGFLWLMYKIIYPTGYFLRGSVNWMYGGLVIAYHAAYRVIKFYLLWPFFKLYWFINFQYNTRIRVFAGRIYGLLVDLFHAMKRRLISLRVALKVRAIRFLFKCNHGLILLRFRYVPKLKHYFLMTYYFFKSIFERAYGICVISFHFVYRIFKTYLLWPFLKLYWFSSFQYEKRIRVLINRNNRK